VRLTAHKISLLERMLACRGFFWLDLRRRFAGARPGASRKLFHPDLGKAMALRLPENPRT